MKGYRLIRNTAEKRAENVNNNTFDVIREEYIL